MLRKLTVFNFLILYLVSFLITFDYAHSLETEWQSSPENEGSIRFIVGEYNSDKSELLAAVHIKLSDEWKTYWKYPGDSGMPVTISFEGSDNIVSHEILWPAPKRYIFYGLESWGYSKEVVIPISIKINNNERPAKIDANIKWAICDEICLFEEGDFNVEVLPNYIREENLTLISKYLQQYPKNIDEQHEAKLIDLKTYKDAIYTKFTSTTNKFDKDVDLFISHENERFKFPKPIIDINDDGKTVEIKSRYIKLLKAAEIIDGELEFTLANDLNSVSFITNIEKVSEENILKPEDINKTQIQDEIVISGDPSVEFEVVDKSNINNDFKKISLITAIIFAFLGGLILNIMPCVLPVLSIKIMSVLKHDASDLKYTRKSFLYTTFGIIFSFLILALITVIIKSFGNSVGWGLQFQQPAFLIFLIVVMVLFTANMFGLFEVFLPAKASQAMNEIIDRKGDAKPLGNFLTGAFAALMATPCTAPFLTTAVSFALTAEVWLIFLIFTFIGLGLAFPYILVAIFPSVAKAFPKPGAWMSKIKTFLGFLLIGFIFWLLWVFFTSSGPIATMILTFITFSLLAFIWFANKFSLNRRKTIMATIYIIAVGFIVPLYFANIVSETRQHVVEWEKLSESRLQKLIDYGQTIFIDVTAEWCLTCQFNKYRATNPMVPFMKERGVILMIGDYTLPSEEIDRFLEKRNVYGIPYNVVYGPYAKEGIKLPEILTKDSIRKAILDAQNIEN